MSQIKERPILFSAPMVKAILDGRKTQTRRIVDMRDIDFVGADGKDGQDWNDPSAWGFETERGDWFTLKQQPGEYQIPCPYGQPGDRLWVKEGLRGVTDAKISGDEKMPIAAYSADGSHIWTKSKFRVPWRWKKSTLPGMFMPKALSRIALEITNVRVGRLNDISEADAEAEGPTRKNFGDFGNELWTSAFRNLWIDINGHGSWETNPWVWALTFKVVST